MKWSTFGIRFNPQNLTDSSHSGSPQFDEISRKSSENFTRNPVHGETDRQTVAIALPPPLSEAEMLAEISVLME